jgi:L-amino acid N-acyltransferase YncA
MIIRPATVDDAAEVQAIYAPIVRDTVISFETEIPSVDEMRARITDKIRTLPWLIGLDEDSRVNGYVHGSKLRDRAAYQWSVEVTAYVRDDCRARGVGKRLYERLFAELAALGYCEAFAGIALPNEASVALHESVGFEPIGTYRRVGFKFGAWRDVAWWQRSLRTSAAPETPQPFNATGFNNPAGPVSQATDFARDLRALVDGTRR